MQIRHPGCRGGWYGTDKSAGAHRPHAFFPNEWGEALDCPGWSDDEANAMAAIEAARKARGGCLECHPSVLAGIYHLLIPDLSDADARTDMLFGTRLVETHRPPGTWRITQEAR